MSIGDLFAYTKSVRRKCKMEWKRCIPPSFAGRAAAEATLAAKKADKTVETFILNVFAKL